MTTDQIRSSLIHSATRYDAAESKKKGHNRHALGIYFVRIDDICADIGRGADPREAITAGFVGRLADICLKDLGLPVLADQAQPARSWAYQPVKPEPAEAE